MVQIRMQNVCILRTGKNEAYLMIRRKLPEEAKGCN
jgi:hypothetical protein